MILDEAGLESGAILNADLCIVGGGPAGITLALAFAHTNHQIVLLESGGLAPEPATQALCGGELAPGSRHPPPHLFRRRQLGGASTIWGGRCTPLDPIDFEPRDWIPHSGWPIGAADLAPFYPRANALCEAGEATYEAAAGTPELLHGFASKHFSADSIERFSCPTDFGARYRNQLHAAPNIRIILHANATRIETTQNAAQVSGIGASTLAGRKLIVRAPNYVLAAGGLEIPRLLLATRDRNPAGLGNDHDQLGRYYMCHIAGTIGRLTPHVPVNHGYLRAPEGPYCRRRLALRPETQRAHRTANLVARLHHPAIADPAHHSAALSALYFCARLIQPEYATRLADGPSPTAATLARHAANIARHPAELARFATHMFHARMLADRKFPSIIVPPRRGTYTLDIHAEQIPNPESRITLGHGTDALGLPRLRVAWRHSETDIQTVRAALQLLQADLAGTQTATLTYNPADVESRMLRHGAYGGHHIGTARMSPTNRTGIVNANCRLHTVQNLYLAGSAIFPTSSQANPTLTIVALALRLADHLQGSFATEARVKQKRLTVAAWIRAGTPDAAERRCHDNSFAAWNGRTAHDQ